jgi:hypothetical protein
LSYRVVSCHRALVRPGRLEEHLLLSLPTREQREGYIASVLLDLMQHHEKHHHQQQQQQQNQQQQQQQEKESGLLEVNIVQTSLLQCAKTCAGLTEFR